MSLVPFSSVYTLLLRCGGAIQCTVTGPKKYSDDLLQGRLELPCTYQFTGPDNVTKKAHQLLLDDQLGTTPLAPHGLETLASPQLPNP